MSQPPPKNPYQAPVQQQPPLQQGRVTEGDATGGVIPYKNPKALIAYYLGIGSMLFFPLGIVSVVLGFMGLAARKRNPIIKGSAHAWIGIVLGSLSMLCWGGIVIALVFGYTSSVRSM
jgi:hypothetical protein